MIYVGQALLRVVHLAIILPLMPESLVPSLRTHSRPSSLFDGSSGEGQSSHLKRDSILVRLAKAPAELVRPFKVLLPTVKVETTSTNPQKDYRLLLIAISYTLSMVVPVSPVD